MEWVSTPSMDLAAVSMIDKAKAAYYEAKRIGINAGLAGEWQNGIETRMVELLEEAAVAWESSGHPWRAAACRDFLRAWRSAA